MSFILVDLKFEIFLSILQNVCKLWDVVVCSSMHWLMERLSTYSTMLKLVKHTLLMLDNRA
jgi:hypothetical protein